MRRHLRQFAATLLTLSPGLAARADTSVCSPTGTSPCTLERTLHMLYWLAGGLGCLLLAVIVLASAIYRKNKKARLLPNSPTERDE